MERGISRFGLLVMMVILVAGSGIDCTDDFPGKAVPDVEVDLPRVSGVCPHDGEPTVLWTTLVEFSFEGEIDADLASDFSFVLTGPGGPVEHGLTFLESTGSVILNPVDDLEPATDYFVEVFKSTAAGEEPHFGSSFKTRGRAEGETTTALFDPTDCHHLFPYPSDVYTVEDLTTSTGLRVTIPENVVPGHIEMETLGGMEGFSFVPRILVSLSDWLDPVCLPDVERSTHPASPVYLVNIDPASEGLGERVPLIVMLDHFGLALSNKEYTLRIETVEALRPGTCYALVLTRRLVGAGYNALEGSEKFDAILAGGDPPAPEYERAWRVVGEAVDFVTSGAAGLPLDRGDLALAIPITTRTHESMAREMMEIREAIALQAALDPPHATLHSVTPGEGDMAAEVYGTFPSPDFRNPCEMIFDPTYWGDLPLTAPMVDLEFYLTLPSAAVEGPAPVVVFMHGIDAYKEQVRSLARALAPDGIATIGIDLVEHGTRATGPNEGLFPAMRILKFERPVEGRDNMRQSAADFMQLVQLLKGDLADLDVLPLGAPDGRPDIDTSDLPFFGFSLGSNIGSLFVAIEPEITAACMPAPMCPFVGIALDVGYFQPGEPLLWLARFATQALGVTATRFLELGTLYQEIYDPADGATYAPMIVKSPLEGRTSRNLFYNQAIGDAQTPCHPTNSMAARHAGLPLMSPFVVEVPGMAVEPTPAVANMPEGVTGGFFQFDVIGEGEQVEHNDLYNSAESLRQTVEFIRYYLENGVGRIINAYEE